MPRRFVHRLRVRYNECDAQGIVFNANYFAYFDVALTEFFRETLGSYQQLLAHGSDVVVLEASARFLASAGFDDVIGLAVVPVRLGRSSMVCEITVARGEDVLVQGRMVHVFVDPAGLAKREMPDAVRRALEPYLAESPEPSADPDPGSTKPARA
jgi:acyl-CoA thioester hydrolase